MLRMSAAALCAFLAAPALAGNTKNILVTGYWPPTNEMLRQFSADPVINPGGWVGMNWEGRGYNIYAYFPEFPDGPTGTCMQLGDSCSWGAGEGDMTVDYQDATADFESFLAAHKPVAIMTTSRANCQLCWEMEPAYKRFRLRTESVFTVDPYGNALVPNYSNDYSDDPDFNEPFGLGPMEDPVGLVRDSNLPEQAIVDAVAAELGTVVIDPFVQTYSGDPASPGGFDFAGAFLSGYAGYMGTRYRDMNNAEDAEFRCVMAGHIHVGQGLWFDLETAIAATEISLREVIRATNQILCPGDYNGDGTASVGDILDYLSGWAAQDPRADFNGDETFSVGDILDYLSSWSGGCPNL